MSEWKVRTLEGTSMTLSEEAIQAFRTSLRGPLVEPDNPQYDEVRQIWNGMHNKCPALIARCTGVADVIAAVNFAREHQLLVAVRGGGHNVSGSGSCDGGMMIDLSLMKGIHVDPRTRTARVQGGATLGDMDRETQVFGLAAPSGNVSTTGVAGLTLGGGLNSLRRKYGLAIDNLLSVDIVTADGQARTASAEEHADLFWGVRGGGGNFGVVTSFKFRLHPVGPMITLCAPWYSTDEAPRLLAAWRDFMRDAPEEFSSFAAIWTVPTAPGIPEEHHGKRAVVLAGVHCGSLDEGAKVIQPLRELGTPLVDMSGPMPWTIVQSAFDPFFPKGQRHYYFKSRNLKNLSDETIAALLLHAVNPPAPPILIAIWHYGGAMQRVGDSETAFMGRQVPFLLSVDCIWDDPAQTEDVLAYARNFIAEMAPYSPGGLYVNFAGLGEEGVNLVQEAYGPNYQRLAELKAKYDPTNLFRLNQNIKPAM
ncbi:MAG TPA: FAD-binding oxidoreductase [Roseiflexaceae bacterium]|nr:FAD-binding oxidoreductase [Roseiflexaceae bacterium]